MADWKPLAAFHYRDRRVSIPAVRQVYRARHEPSGEVVGAIVYAAPALNLSIRNQIFGERYRIGGRSVLNQEKAQLVNREIELIIRMVCAPAFRGIGLGVRLIRETLVLRPARFVELSSAMGSLNPFCAKAGMTVHHCPRPKNTEKVLGGLRSIGLSEEQCANPAEIRRALDRMAPKSRKWLEDLIMWYAERWAKARSNRMDHATLDDAIKRVAANATLCSSYALWRNPAWRSRTEA